MTIPGSEAMYNPDAKAPVKGKLIEMGNLISADLDGTKHEYQRAILIQFDSVEDARRAVVDGICEFVWP
jgi:hypothetical protein